MPTKIIQYAYKSLCALFFVIGHVHASGVAPYITLNSSLQLELEIERLAVIANIPNLTKPYNVATVFHYLDKIQDTHPRLYRRIKNALEDYTRRSGVTLFRAGVHSGGGHNNAVPHVMPNSRGNNVDARANVSFRSHWQVVDWFAIYAGIEAWYYPDIDHSSDFIQPSGSLISIGTDWAQLDIGYKDRWLSPFQGSAQLISTNAQTMPSLSLSNNSPIDIRGVNVNYEVFTAVMSKQPVLFEGEFSREDPPYIAGLHISFQPVEWVTLGATRVFQFAGGRRPFSLSTLAKAFVDPRGADNDADVDAESGNQIAAISGKVNFDGPVPFSFSLEFAGEDTSNNKEYQLGNTAINSGLFFPYFFSDALSMTYEHSIWQDGWYVNNVYADGFSNESVIVGHWNRQTLNAFDNSLAYGGESHFLKLQWQSQYDHVVSAVFRTNKYNTQSNRSDFQRAWELELDYAYPWKQHILSAELYGGEDELGFGFLKAGVNFQWK